MDPNLWRALAGKSVYIPSVGSHVCYFVRGHLEQAIQTPSISPSALSNPFLNCIVTHIDYNVDDLTDEVCLKLKLHPIQPGEDVSRFRCGDGNGGGGGGGVDRVEFVSFSKGLTSSDANNGGGFSVPRNCADYVFPPLDYNAEPPVQTLSITDVHGVVWIFRHIYRGTPRRHLLTTGWSKFVNHKKLVANDIVVFAKNPRGDVFVGIRRACSSRAIEGGDCGRWNGQFGGVRYRVEEGRSGDGGREVFSRRSIGKLPAEAVAKAAELAAQFKPFEVLYYPRVGCSDFVVDVERVSRSMNYQWYAGIRVKMTIESDDSQKTTTYQGTVNSICISENGSPWRMLEVEPLL